MGGPVPPASQSVIALVVIVSVLLVGSSTGPPDDPDPVSAATMDVDDAAVDLDEQSPLLLPGLAPGARCVVSADAAAVIMCRRRRPICCLRSSLELSAIPDGSVVEVLQPNLRLFGASRRERVVGVRVVTSLDSTLNGVFGSIPMRWLQAYGDFLSAIRRPPSPPPPPPKPTADDDVPAPVAPEPDPAVQPPRTERDAFLVRIGIDPDTADPITAVMILSRLAEGAHDIDGDVIRAVLGPAAPVALDHVRVRDGRVVIRLRQRQTVTLQTPPGFVLDDAGRLLPRTRQTRRLALRDEIEVALDPGGRVAGVRHGDVSVVKGPIAIGVKVRTERCPGRVDTDGKGRAIVEVDGDGAAVRDADGAYRVRRYDDWVVIAALGKTHWFGLDQLQRHGINPLGF